MKKVFAVIAIAIVAFTAFADAGVGDGSALTLSAKVSAVEPQFALYGSKTSLTADMVKADDSINTGVEIDANDVKIYIKVGQIAKSKYKGTATITITPTVFANTDADLEAANKTALPSVANITKGTDSNFTVGTMSANDSTKVVTIEVTYNGKPVGSSATAAAPVAIGTFDYTWAHVETLAAGTYQATITMGVQVE